MTNRLAIANAGPFKMLVKQLGSENSKVNNLAVAVMSKLSGDSEENVSEIAKWNGVQPLVALLAPGKDPLIRETQAHAVVVLTDMTTRSLEHAETVANEGGIEPLVGLLATAETLETKSWAADCLGNVAQLLSPEVGSAGAIEPLVELLKTESTFARQKAAYAPHWHCRRWADEPGRRQQEWWHPAAC